MVPDFAEAYARWVREAVLQGSRPGIFLRHLVHLQLALSLKGNENPRLRWMEVQMTRLKNLAPPFRRH